MNETASDKEYGALGQYILAPCSAQNLSLRQASLRSGLEAGTISKLLQRDGRFIPTPDTLSRIAEGLHGDFLQMMRLAGHLPPIEDGGINDAELYLKMQRLQELVQQVARRDPDAARRLMGLVITPFEVMLALETDERVEEGKVNERRSSVVRGTVGPVGEA